MQNISFSDLTWYLFDIRSPTNPFNLVLFSVKKSFVGMTFSDLNTHNKARVLD